MSKFKVGDLVCFKECELPEFYGSVYCVFGRTMMGMLNNEIVILDGTKERRVLESSLRLATSEEITAGRRLCQK